MSAYKDALAEFGLDDEEEQEREQHFRDEGLGAFITLDVEKLQEGR